MPNLNNFIVSYMLKQYHDKTNTFYWGELLVMTKWSNRHVMINYISQQIPYFSYAKDYVAVIILLYHWIFTWLIDRIC